jgi:predicted GIY-YIG superfamily endonuclease
MKNYYVYKYVVDGNIIYVGLTDNLRRRIKEHASGVGLESKFLPYLETADIYYHRCGNKTEMKALESLLINTYKPILNVVDVETGESTISTSIDWQSYCENEFKEALDYDLQKYSKSLKSNKTRIANYQIRQEQLVSEMNSLRSFYSYAASHIDALARNPYASFSIPRSCLPNGDAIFVSTRLVPVWYDEQDMQGDVCLVQFSGEFLRELFAVSHQDDWIERTMDMVGNNECRELSERIANLSATNKKLEQKILSLKNELLG